MTTGRIRGYNKPKKSRRMEQDEEFKFDDPNFGELSHTKIKLVYWAMIRETLKRWTKEDGTVIGDGEYKQIQRIVYRHFKNIQEELGLLGLFGLRFAHHIEPKLCQKCKKLFTKKGLE